MFFFQGKSVRTVSRHWRNTNTHERRVESVECRLCPSQIHTERRGNFYPGTRRKLSRFNSSSSICQRVKSACAVLRYRRTAAAANPEVTVLPSWAAPTAVYCTLPNGTAFDYRAQYTVKPELLKVLRASPRAKPCLTTPRWAFLFFFQRRECDYLPTPKGKLKPCISFPCENKLRFNFFCLQAMRLLSGYILSKIHLLVDERNISVCIVKGDQLGKAFIVAAFARCQVG